MLENINIDERDIFNFVFFNDLLSEEKIRYIENNEEKIEGINFYRNLKKSITEPLSKEIKEKIAAKIPVYKTSKIIKLYPVKDELEKKLSEVPILAAASPEQQPAVSAQSFIDEDKTFLIRLLRMDNKTKIFTFPITHTDIKDFNIILYPEERTYSIHNGEPIEIESTP
ncbi:MAG: hypothetical protein IIA49_08680, partial [Bacteroidetes bacterium]|nr:hypothetical protein [Bacteroidota bacterium]